MSRVRSELQTAGHTVVLATGGTGGHIYPALALADRLAGHGVHCVLIGQAGGLEEKLSADAGVEFIGVQSGKLDRQRPDPRELLRALNGVRQAWGHLLRLRPSLVIGFGGFASLPASAAAAWLRLPLWLNEQNAYPGIVTRLLGRRAEQVIVSVAAALERINARSTSVIPYAIDELRTDRSEARRQLGLPEDGLLTLIMGGSQGSVALNQATLQALATFGNDAPLTLHVTGPNNLETVQAELLASGLDLPGHHLQGYVDGRVAFAAADLAITRAGIGTLSMAAFHGVPLIMVPLPTSAENHQFHNAKALADSGAGVLLPQSGLSELPATWRSLLDPARLASARQAISGFSPEGALSKFTDAVLNRLQQGVAR